MDTLARWLIVAAVIDLAFTLICGAGIIALAALWPDPTPNQQATFEAMANGWYVGVRVISGLLGPVGILRLLNR